MADAFDLRIPEAISLVLTSLELQLSSSSLTKLTSNLRTFEKVLRGAAVERISDIDSTHVAEFLHLYTVRHGEYRDPSASTIRNRRWAIRTFAGLLAKLGSAVPALLMTADAPGRPISNPRPLTDPEMERVRSASRGSLFESRVPTLVALAEITATPAEMAAVSIEDVDARTGRVHLRGATGHLPRNNQLSDWGLEVVLARLDLIDAKECDLLVLSRRGIESSTATASITGDLRKALDRAQVADPTVRPSSIRAWSAKKHFDKYGRIDGVAHWLGTPSLDTAASIINWDWQR